MLRTNIKLLLSFLIKPLIDAVSKMWTPLKVHQRKEGPNPDAVNHATLEPHLLRPLLFSAASELNDSSGDDRVVLATDMDKNEAETSIAGYLGFLLPRGFSPSLPPGVRDHLQSLVTDDDDDDDEDEDEDEDTCDKKSSCCDDSDDLTCSGAQTNRGKDQRESVLRQNNSLCDAAVIHLAQLPNNLARGRFIEHLFRQHTLAPVWADYTDSTIDASANDKEKLHNFLHSLQFVNVDTKSDDPAVRHINPLKNTCCLRVVVVSNETNIGASTHQLVQDMFGLHSLHAEDKRIGVSQTWATSLLEIGVGYLPRQEQQLGDEVRAIPCLVFHVVGDYGVLWKAVLQDLADFVFLEATGQPGNAVNEEVFQSGLPKKQCVAWYPCATDGGTVDKLTNHVVARGILRNSRRLRTLQKRLVDMHAKHTSKKDLGDSCGISDELVAVLSIDYDFNQPRKDALVLQESFCTERRAFDTKHSRTATERAREKSDGIIKGQERFRANHAEGQLGLSLVRAVLTIARQQHARDRVTAFHLLERELAEKCESHLADLIKQANKARDAAAANPDDGGKREHAIELNNQINDFNVTLDHIWREVGQIYAWSPQREPVKDLPRLAAQHMLDGHHMELFDGDALAANTKWVSAVFHELNRLLQAKHGGRSSPRFLVHSMFGAQSSGKTTTANHLYGTRLKASVGRCTIGANIQLIPCKNRPEYDYVLLLDTEGVRAPEYSQLESSRRRDGVLAMLSFLLADTTTVVIPGEDDKVVRDLLPIVLDAYRGSQVGEASGGQLATKVMFLYNKLDQTNVGKLRAQVESLSKTLHEAEQQVHRGDSFFFHNTDELLQQATDDADKDGRAPAPFIGQLRLYVDGAQHSDVHVVGQLKSGNYPPVDVPQQDYAKRLLELREYIHDRVCERDTEHQKQWTPRTLSDISDLMDSVWACLDNTHFAVSFLSLTEKRQYGRMTHTINQVQRDLTTAYRAKYKGLEKAVRVAAHRMEAGALETQVQEMTQNWNSQLEAHGDMAQGKIGGKVASFLKHFPKWETQEQARWDEFCRKQRQHWASLLRGVIANELGHKQEKRRIQRGLRAKLMREFDSSTSARVSDTVVEARFRPWFEKEMSAIKERTPPIAPQIPGRMRQVCMSFANGDKTLEAAILQEHMPSLEPNKPFPVKVPQTNQEEQQRFWQRALASIMGPRSSTVDGHELVKRISDRIVEDVLLGCQYYADDVVTKAFIRGNKETERSGVTAKKFKEALLHTVYWNLQRQLMQIQEQWDSQNNIYCCLRKDRSTFLSLARSIMQGLRGFDLYKDSIKRELSEHWQECFFERFAKKHAEQLARQPFFTSPQIILALLDLELLRRHDRGDVRQMLHLIQDGRFHFEEMTRRASGQFLSKQLASEFRLFMRDIQRCFDDSVLHGHCEGATAMLTAIRQEADCRKLTTLHARFGNIVVGEGVERQLRESGDAEHRLKQLLREVRTMSSPVSGDFKLNAILREWVFSERYHVQEALNEISKLQFADGLANAKPRCAEPCPQCCFPCLTEKGHSSKHDCEHQPGGLTGVAWYQTRDLMAESCRRCVQDNIYMVFSSSRKVPYRQFNDVYPEWETPHMNRRQYVREYLYYHHVQEVAEYYDMSRAGSSQCCPSSYNHVKSSLEADLHQMFEDSFCPVLQDLSWL